MFQKSLSTICVVTISIAMLAGITAKAQDFADESIDSIRYLASWYGVSHQGRPTANGERFDRQALTAARLASVRHDRTRYEPCEREAGDGPNQRSWAVLSRTRDGSIGSRRSSSWHAAAWACVGFDRDCGLTIPIAATRFSAHDR
jgi:hypothetical protein